MSQFFVDYPLRLFCVNEQENFEIFQSEIKKVFQVMRFRRDRKGLEKELETNEEYRKVDEETLEVISVMLDAPEIWGNREKYMLSETEEYGMCQAVREIREEGRQEGRQLCCVTNIKNLMKNLGITATRVMELLEVPQGERERYLELL